MFYVYVYVFFFFFFKFWFGLVWFWLAGNNGDVGPSGDLHWRYSCCHVRSSIFLGFFFFFNYQLFFNFSPIITCPNLIFYFFEIVSNRPRSKDWSCYMWLWENIWNKIAVKNWLLLWLFYWVKIYDYIWLKRIGGN